MKQGGPICSEFTALFPEKVKKVALLAPAAYIGVVSSINLGGLAVLTASSGRPPRLDSGAF